MATKRKHQPTTDAGIRRLEPGESIELFRDDAGVQTIAVRHADGRVVTIYRLFPDGTRVHGYDLPINEVW